MSVGAQPPNSPENYYAWKPDQRRHLSVGAVIVNSDNQILVMHLERVDGKFFLPTKSHLPDQTLESSLKGIEQRVGWQIELQNFLGVVTSEFPIPEGGNVTKYTLWYLCKPLGEVARDPQDRDADAVIEWRTKAELGQLFADQAAISSDVDQRGVLQLLP